MTPNSPILVHPDSSKKYIIHTDASDTCIGAVLLQEHNGVCRPVSYMSHKLSDQQKRYAAIEREALAVVVALKNGAVIYMGQNLRYLGVICLLRVYFPLK